MYAESPAGPREGRQLAVVHPPIRSRRVNPSPAIQEAPLGARNPGWGQGGTGLGGLGEGTSFTNRRWYLSSLQVHGLAHHHPTSLGSSLYSGTTKHGLSRAIDTRWLTN